MALSKGVFLTPLITRHVSARRKALQVELVYQSANGLLFPVPVGFYSDGASVPRFLWSLYPPFGDAYEPAAWLHDFLYAYADVVSGSEDDGSLSRAEADGLFDEAMEALAFRAAGRRVVFNGVRLGGWRSWRRYRREAAARRAVQEVQRAAAAWIPPRW